MRKDGGYLVINSAFGMSEMSTFTCTHCNKVVAVKTKANPDDIGGFCYCCMKMVCPQCVGKPCDPVEKKLERAEASYHARRSYSQ